MLGLHLRDLALASHGVVTLDRDDVLEGYRRLRLRSNLEPSTASVLKLGEALDVEQIVSGTFSVTAAPAFAASLSIPGDAKSSGDLSESSHWMWSHDAKTW